MFERVCVCVCVPCLAVYVHRQWDPAPVSPRFTKQHVAVGLARNAEWTCSIVEPGEAGRGRGGGVHKVAGVNVLLRGHCGSESPVSPSPSLQSVVPKRSSSRVSSGSTAAVYL